MKLSVITVTWNTEELIAEQIRSVSSGCNTYELEQILVDNGSRDNTVEIIKTFDHVTCIENGENLGFSAANNIGLAKAKGEYLLFLNPDMRVEEGSLDKIIDWMEAHPKVAIASPKLVDEHGNINPDAAPRRFPRVWEQLAIIFKWPHIVPGILSKYHMKGFDFDKEQAVDSVRGSFMIMRREFVEKLGWAFDPRYFIWYEDVDICKEAYKHGYTVVYTPVISCVDYVGQSFKKHMTLWKQKNFTRSMQIYFEKWGPRWGAQAIATARPFGIAMAWVSDTLRSKK